MLNDTQVLKKSNIITETMMMEDFSGKATTIKTTEETLANANNCHEL